MTDSSANLALPYLLPAQAQKHVTHNEALARLDVLAQLAVEGFGATAPPVAPQEGEVHALGPVPTGAWAGQGDRLAAWIGGAWVFVVPRTGWRAWGRAEGRLRIRTAGGWQDATALGGLDNLPGVGIGTAHDATNRLAVAGAASLFSHGGAGHQMKINKAAAADTASLLFQSNWAGRAEIGLTGNDNLSVRVSADGTTFATALTVDRTTARPAAPNGLTVTGSVTGTAITQGATDTTAGRLLKVGDVGILSTPPVLSGATGIRDRQLRGGSYSYNTTAPGQNPDSAFSWLHALSVMRLSATLTGSVELGVYLSCRAANTASNLKLWYGVDSSVAGEINWTEIFTQRSILGSVSQSGGVPTGALIETGSNANGFFTRFASGLQICRRSFAASSSAATTWTFPAAFAAEPDVTGTAQATVLSAVCLDTAPTTTAVTFSARDKNDARRADTCNMLAIGRWF